MLELDDGTRIRESVAICRYLEALHPQPPLMGVDPKDTAIIEMWNREIEMEGMAGVADAFRNKVRGLAGRAVPGTTEETPQIPELVERGRGAALRCWRRLDAHLDGREFIAGERFTIADITAYVMVWFAAWIKLTIPEEQRHLQAWYDRVAARPSASA
jgi:glutathione S-transferase